MVSEGDGADGPGVGCPGHSPVVPSLPRLPSSSVLNSGSFCGRPSPLAHCPTASEFIDISPSRPFRPPQLRAPVPLDLGLCLSGSVGHCLWSQPSLSLWHPPWPVGLPLSGSLLPWFSLQGFVGGLSLVLWDSPVSLVCFSCVCLSPSTLPHPPDSSRAPPFAPHSSPPPPCLPPLSVAQPCRQTPWTAG